MSVLDRIKGFKVYELSLSQGYVSQWGVVEAVRELLQNAIDSDSPFEFNFSGTTLSIHSKSSGLSPRTLLLGTSSKSDDDSKIGQFGEGYKLALLVLLRSGYPVKIFNGQVMWVPKFRYSKTYDADMLVVVEQRLKKTYQGLTFVVEGLSEADQSAIKASCLQMQDYVPPIFECEHGSILPLDYAGKLYVNGLYVCNTGFRYGYNLHPSVVKLERDRQTVSVFDLAFIVKDLWLMSGEDDIIYDMLQRKAMDVKYVNYAGGSAKTRLAGYSALAFREQYPQAVAVSNQEEREEAEQQGLQAVMVEPEIRTLIMYHPVYTAPISNVPKPKTPYEILSEFITQYRVEMSENSVIAFGEILDKAHSWK